MKKINRKVILTNVINEPVTITIVSEEITNNRTEKLLGLAFDSEFKYETDINDIC